MIDPDGIQIQETNLPAVIELKNIPEFDTQCWCLEDEKDYNKFIAEVEKQVRRSFEYRRFINYIRDNMQMNQCAFLKEVTNQETFDHVTNWMATINQYTTKNLSTILVGNNV